MPSHREVTASEEEKNPSTSEGNECHGKDNYQLSVRLQKERKERCNVDGSGKKSGHLDLPISTNSPSMTDPFKLKYQLTPFKTLFLQSRPGVTP